MAGGWGAGDTDHVWGQGLHVIKRCLQSIGVQVHHHDVLQGFLPHSLHWGVGGGGRSGPEDLGRGRVHTPPPPMPSRPTPSYLSETGMHSDEVGHRRAADDRGSRVTQAPPPGPQDPRLLSQALPPPQAPPLTSSSPVNAAAAWESARAPSAWDTGERRTRGHRRSARDGWRGPLGVRAWTPNFKDSSLGRWLPRLHSSRPQSPVSLHPLPQRILDKK